MNNNIIKIALTALIVLLSGTTTAGELDDKKTYLGLDQIGRDIADSEFKQQLIAADSGDTNAQIFVGLSYLKGTFCAVNLKKGIMYLQSAAKKNDPGALVLLGIAYREARGVSQDYKKSKELIFKAAELSNTTAQHELAMIYTNGWGVDVDYVEAYKWIYICNEGIYSNHGFDQQVESKLTLTQINEAREKAEYWFKSHPKQPRVRRIGE